MKTWKERYIPAMHQAHSESLGEAYWKANSELLLPAPSVKLPGYPILNEMTGGFRPFEFSILCGATGTGKTTLCANLSADLLGQGIPQFIASVETGHTDYVKRMMCAMVGYDWNTGDPVDMDKLKIFDATHGGAFKQSCAVMSLYDNRTSVELLMADIATAVSQQCAKVAIIDNLNFFLEITSAANAIVEMDRVIHEMIIFCKQVPVHIVMVMHPKKTDGGRVESEFDIKGSSTAVQEAHNVFLFNRPGQQLLEDGIALETDRELKIAKMRRKGKFVGRRLLLSSQNGVRYVEKARVSQ